MAIKSVLFGFAFALIATTAVHAQSVHTLPVGTEFDGKVKFARSEVPLPPGKWKLAATGEQFSVPYGGHMRVRLPYAHLVRIEKGQLAGLVTINGTLQYDNNNWARESSCDRAGQILATADKNLNPTDQWCLYITHTAMDWGRTNDVPEYFAGLFAWIRSEKIRARTTMLMTGVNIVKGGEFLNVLYQIDPAEFGGPSVQAANWFQSGWHTRTLDDDPRRRLFADAWVEWSTPMLDAVRAGFGRTLAGYEPRAWPAPRSTPASIAAVRVGTVFETKGGGFEVTEIDGATIVVANAAKRPSTWQVGGLVFITSRTKIDTAVAEKIFPLKVGNRVEFDQRAAMGEHGWHHVLEVVGTERLDVGGRSYDTFVVEDTTNTISDSQGNVRRKRTVWFAPEAGWLLKVHDLPISGTNDRGTNWEVVKITPPG